TTLPASDPCNRGRAAEPAVGQLRRGTTRTGSAASGHPGTQSDQPSGAPTGRDACAVAAVRDCARPNQWRPDRIAAAAHGQAKRLGDRRTRWLPDRLLLVAWGGPPEPAHL